MKEFNDAFQLHIDNECPAGIDEFYRFMQKREHPQYPNLKPGGVINMRNLGMMGNGPSSPTNGYAIQYYLTKNNLEDFLFTIYTIRCNKQHGDKDPMNDNDKELLLKASLALKDFLTFIFNQ
ncbi:MAG: hypothetical protein PHH16_00750 [Candidatus Gracilibacteria bacterium]|nr:hypothetical protein [Candidatus Gracilibacteria bacterium]